MTSSGPMRYDFFDNNCSSSERGDSIGGEVCIPRFIAAVSIRIAGGGVSSWIEVSFFAGGGRIAGGGVRASSSLFVGGGSGAMAVACGVEGTAGGGSGDGTDLSLEDSGAAMGAGANALEATAWRSAAGVSMSVNRFL